MKRSLFSNSYQIDQAKVETLRLLYFRLGYCGIDEEVKALTLVSIGAAGSLFNLFIVFFKAFMRSFLSSFVYFFAEKSTLSWPLKRPESQKRKCLDF